MFRLTVTTIFVLVHYASQSQGGIDHIKNQPYLREAVNVNCDSTNGDNLSLRICANLAYQKSDSLLVVVYQKILQNADDSTRNHLVSVQKLWRQLRDEHCALVWDQYKDGNGHFKAITYLSCLKLLTDNRTRELERLVEGQ